jgi:hypothetical protein
MKTKTLLNAVTAAVSGIKSNNKDAQNLLFKGGYLSSWSAAISASVKLPEDAKELTGIINGLDLVKFLSKLNKEEIEISCTDKEWEITSGTMSASLTTRTDAGIDSKVEKLTKEIDSLEWHALPENFYQALAVCDIPNNTKKTSGVFIGKDLMLSTDNIRVNRVVLDKEFSTNVWLSQFSVAELRRLKLSFKEYAVSKRWLYLRTEEDKNAVQLIFACNRLDDTNYDYKTFSAFLDKAQEGIFAEGELPDLTQALNMASCFDDSVELSDSDVFNNVIGLTFDKKNITVSSQRKASGAYKEKLPYPEKKTLDIEEPLKIQVTSFFLSEACRFSKHFGLAKVGKHTLILFKGKDFVSAVMVLA